MTYEQLDRSIDADSDSEDELAEQAHLYRSTPVLIFTHRYISYVLAVVSNPFSCSGPTQRQRPRRIRRRLANLAHTARHLRPKHQPVAMLAAAPADGVGQTRGS